MRGPTVVLAFAGLTLAWAVLFGAGIQPEDRNAALLFFGAISAFYWSFRSAQTAPPLTFWQSAALIAFPCYLLFQVIPLPPTILEALSPPRAELAAALAQIIPNLTRAPISVTPAASLFGFFGFLGYITAFNVVRDIAWRFTDSNNWAVAFPLIGVATVEALVGIFQLLAKGSIRGTYLDRDHFSAFLEMALPLTLVCGYDAFRRHRLQADDPSRPAIVACVLWGISLLLLIAILESGSLAASFVVLSSLFATGLFVVLPHLKTQRVKWFSAGALAIALLAFLIVFPPSSFLEHLSDLAASDKSPSEQLALWRETFPMLSEFRWFGTGLGGFESAFLKYQGTVGALRIVSAHNDYLHYLIELGLVGFTILAVACIGVARSAIRAALFVDDVPRRLLAAAGVGCFVAIVLRSAFNSNLLVPANAIAIAWISGLVSANGLE